MTSKLKTNQIQQAITAHQEGKLDEAEILYRKILEIEPFHLDTNHNLGLLMMRENIKKNALPLLKIAFEGNPKIEQYFFSYINALISTNELTEAETIIKKL